METTSSFAPCQDDIETAFDHVFLPCNLDRRSHQRLLSSWIPALQSGEPKLYGKALAELLEIQWIWPWFDEWHTTFREVGRWPYMWRRGAADFTKFGPKDHESLVPAKIVLASHTLSGISNNVQRFNQMMDYKRDRVLRRSASIGCPVEDAVGDDYERHMVMSDWRTWPPFFPGDRNQVLPVDRSHLERFSKRNRPKS